MPRKLSHSLNSSVHEPSLVQMMGTCKAEGQQPALIPAALEFACLTTAQLTREQNERPLLLPVKSRGKFSRAAGFSHLVQPTWALHY